jgi:hypothetical protein
VPLEKDAKGGLIALGDEPPQEVPVGERLQARVFDRPAEELQDRPGLGSGHHGSPGRNEPLPIVAPRANQRRRIFSAATAPALAAAGSLVVFIVWVYYSGQILLLGAELTKAYANRFGSRIRPAENAVPVTDEAHAQQGLPRQTSTPGARQ